MSSSCSHYGLVLKEDNAYKMMNLACSWTNILLSLPTAVMNMSLIVALLSSSDWSKPCDLLLLNLAFTDFLAGFVNMPVQFIVFRFISQGQDPCRFANFTTPVGYILGIASILMISMIAMERYISVFHPFFHLAKLQPSSIAAAVIVVWILSISFLMPSVIIQEDDFLNAAVPVIAIVCSSTNFYCYFRILLRARKVRMQINTEVARLGQRNASAKEKSLVYVGGLIMVSITACYTPIAISSFLAVTGYEQTTIEYMICWSWTLAMANSLINPVISCTFNATIRKRIHKMWTCKRQGRVLQQRQPAMTQRLELRSV